MYLQAKSETRLAKGKDIRFYFELFEDKVPSMRHWDSNHIPSCRGDWDVRFYRFLLLLVCLLLEFANVHFCVFRDFDGPKGGKLVFALLVRIVLWLLFFH